MLAVAQHRETFHYLNWIPSESGPLVTHFGSYKPESEHSGASGNPFTTVFQSLFSRVNNGESICTLSLNLEDLYLSSCNTTEDSDELFQWHLQQTQDDIIKDVLDFYHFPMASPNRAILNIAIPKRLRKSVQESMEEIKTKMNALGVGIFSAEEGARQWFNAGQLKSYLIWKFGRMKNDELLLIEDGSLTACFSLNRSGNKVKPNWQLGNNQRTNEIIIEISKRKFLINIFIN